MRKQLIVVNKKDQVLGYETKKACHHGRGFLHRAFSILIFNKNGELLLQKRSREKELWSLFWSNSCCSHPIKGEEIKAAAEKRLKEELGFTVPLKFLFKFSYEVKYQEIGIEKEVCSVFKGDYDGSVIPKKKEVTEIRWITLEGLGKEMEKKSEVFTPWFKIMINRYKSLRGF